MVLRGTLIALNAYIGNEEKSQVKNLSSYLKRLEKEKQNKPKARRRKEGIKTKAEINEMENRKTIEEINETKIWFLGKKITKIHKPVGRLMKQKEGRHKLPIIRMK